MDGAVAERDADYHTDEHAWLLQQAAALRARRLSALDAENLAEFLEDMARSEVREVAARLRVLYLHLLKFRVQPERATPSWALSVLNTQAELEDLFESASLRREGERALPRAFERARRAAAAEAGLPPDAFPADNPWTLDEALRWERPVEQAPRVAKRREGR
jgi:hypothetical protein